MWKLNLYFIQFAYNVFIGHAFSISRTLILEGRPVLRVLKSLQWDDSKVCRVSIKGKGMLKYYRRKNCFSRMNLISLSLSLSLSSMHLSTCSGCYRYTVVTTYLFSFPSYITESTCRNWNSSIAPIWLFFIMFDTFQPLYQNYVSKWTSRYLFWNQFKVYSFFLTKI